MQVELNDFSESSQNNCKEFEFKLPHFLKL